MKSFSEGECDMADIIKNEIEFEYEDDIETEEETTFDDLTEKLMRISIDTTNLEEVKFDKANFQKGMKDASYLCGMLTALMNVGISAVDALAYCMNESTMDNNIKLNEMVNEVEMAKLKAELICNEKKVL